MSIVREFFKALNVEEAKFVARLPEDRLGLQLRCALSELDLICYNIQHAEEKSFEHQEHHYIL